MKEEYIYTNKDIAFLFKKIMELDIESSRLRSEIDFLKNRLAFTRNSSYGYFGGIPGFQSII